MQITRTSMLSGVIRTWEIDVTEGQLHDWMMGMVIQRAMPNLTADEREFIMTGITPVEWDAEYGEE